MKTRSVGAVLCLGLVALAAWVAGRGDGGRKPGGWAEVAPGVLRSPGLPAGYALVSGEKALLIDSDRKGTRLNSSHRSLSRMPSSA